MKKTKREWNNLNSSDKNITQYNQLQFNPNN